MAVGEKGLVSVIVPTFDRAHLLVEAMQSVYDQTYRPIELILIDDGSTDATHEIANEWGAEHSSDQFRFAYLCQQRMGAPAARNVGLAASHGEFIQFLDSDDLLCPGRLSRIVRVFLETSCDYIYTGLDRFCERCGQVIQRHLPDSTANHLATLCEGRLWGSTLQFCWRRCLVDEIGGWDTSMVVYQDYDYVIRTILASSNGVALREILSRERMGGASRISNVRATRAGYDSFLRAAAKLCVGIGSADVSQTAKDKFISYLYYKTLPSYARYPDLWNRVEELVRSIAYRPSSSGEFIKLLIWRASRMWHAVLLHASDSKNRLPGMIRNKSTRLHVCSLH